MLKYDIVDRFLQNFDLPKLQEMNINNFMYWDVKKIIIKQKWSFTTIKTDL